MKLLYLSGGASDSGGVTTQQLAKIAPALQISNVATVDEAITEIRKGGWHGLLTPPTIVEHDTLALIARLRQDRVPIAIVPVVTEWRQEFFSAAVAAGADDVLLVRGETAVHAGETLSRIKQSPHLKPAEERRLRVLYVGKDTLVGSLLDQVPFVKVERATSVADGAIAGRTPGAGPDALRADAVIIDDMPGESPSVQVLKFVRTHAPDLPIVVLTAPNAGEIAAGVLDLGVDDCIPKSGIYRRRLIAALNRVHQRHDLAVQHTTLKARETRLRQIVENLPEGLTIVSGDGTILAVNGAGLPVFGVSKPGDVVGREFYAFVVPERRDEARAFVAKVGAGQRANITIDLQALDGVTRTIEVDGVMLERDARGAPGVIAVLRPPRQANADEAQIARANLAAVTEEAKQRLTALTTELQKAKTSQLAERSAWDAARTQLEQRLQALITDADVRHGLDIRLATAETALGDVTEARKQLGAELDAVRAELEAARVELRQAREDHRSNRETWDASRRQLESRVTDAQASAVARVEVEARLEAARTNLRQAADTFAAERAGWDATRRQLESRLHEAQASAGVRSELEAELDASRAELRYLTETSSRDRAAWDMTRRTLEEQLQDARHAHTAERSAWQADREALEQRVSASGSAEADRARLEEELRTSLAQHAAYLEAQSVERATRQRERAELEALRTAVDEERAHRIKLDDELAVARAEASGRVTALEVEHAATRRSLEAQIDDAETRAQRMAAESHAAHHELTSHLATVATSYDRLAQSRLFGYALTTLEGRLLRCNDTFARLFGYADSQDAMTRSNGDPFPPIAGREGLDARLLVERVIPQVESCLERVDGTPITVLESAAIVPTPADLEDAGGERELIERLIIDMSGSSALEGRLRQARRLEEVGTLATAMAPDIAALIHAIDETGAQIAADLSAKDAQQALLDKIRTRAARANKLVRQLIAFSRRQVQAPPPVDLNAAVGRAAPMLTRLVGPHIEFDIRLGKADGVAANEDDLEQLLTTLVVSGRDLLPVGGTLILETTRLDFEEPGSSDGPIGPRVLLSVSASGYGVKPVQQAVAVDGVAQRCGGEVQMTDEPGRRATLQVYFTRCAPAQAPRALVRHIAERDAVPADHWSWAPD